MKQKLTTVQYDQITTGENVRLPNNMKLDTLTDSIQSSGLHEPIMVWRKGADDYEVLRGHRRIMSIGNVLEKDAQAFNHHFPQGQIPAIVVTDITPSDAIRLKVDHGTQESLSDPMEVQLAANMLFSVGLTEADVAVELAGLLDRLHPMSAKNREKLAELRKSKAEAEAKGLTTDAEAKGKEIRDFVAKNRRGLVQGLHYVYRCPYKVFAAKYFHACGVKLPAVKTDDFVPRITTGQVVKLYKAFQKDLEVLENGQQKYTRAVPGPAFLEAYDKLVAEQKKAADKPKGTRPKARSAKDLTEEAKQYESVGFNQLTRVHAGQEVEGYDPAKMDHILFVAELVRKYNAELWKQCEAFAAKKQEELVKKVASEAKASDKADDAS